MMTQCAMPRRLASLPLASTLILKIYLRDSLLSGVDQLLPSDN